MRDQLRQLAYTPFERLDVRRPVDRIDFIVDRCRGRSVLDLGGFDETALVKRGTSHWLHGRIGDVAASVLGVDSSTAIPDGGIATGPRSRIVRGDVSDIGGVVPAESRIEVIVAGELVEHLADTLGFLGAMRREFPGRELIITTPNATSLTNFLLAIGRRENNHPDHLQVYSYKTLNTLALRAGVQRWVIRPYPMRFTELALRSNGVKGRAVSAAETIVNLGERMFPLLSGGLILHIEEL